MLKEVQRLEIVMVLRRCQQCGKTKRLEAFPHLVESNGQIGGSRRKVCAACCQRESSRRSAMRRREP